MKTLLYFTLIGLLLGVGACKKEKANPCDGVVCSTNSKCIDDICVCDSGWTGSACNVEVLPIDSFVGDYYMTTVGGSTNVISVTRVNDSTLHFYGYDLKYDSHQPNSFTFSWSVSPNLYGDLIFHRPFNDDSAFYHQTIGSAGSAGSHTYMRGIKIH